MTLDYFYGQAGELFSFYRIPKALFQEQRFQNLSTDAKTLYGILLDRMSLSVKNGWLDEQNRVFIIFTIDVVSVDILQEMLGICRKNAYLLVKQNKIHSARVGRSYKIPKLCVVEYLIDQNRQLGGMRLSNSLAPSLQNTPESSKLMMPKQRTFGYEQKGASL